MKYDNIINKEKNTLKTLALGSYNNGGIIYQLINEGCLDSLILKKIKLKKQYPLLKKKLLNNEEFIDALDILIMYFDNSFPPLYYKHHRLSNLFEDKTPLSLIFDKKINNNNYILKKFFIENMFDNIKYIYDEHKSFFVDLNIKKNMVLTNKNIDILYNFMKYLNWCNYNDKTMYYVFTNYNTLIKEKKFNNNDLKRIKLDVWCNYNEQWSKLISNYNKHINEVKNLTNIEHYKY